MHREGVLSGLPSVVVKRSDAVLQVAIGNPPGFAAHHHVTRACDSRRTAPFWFRRVSTLKSEYINRRLS